MEGDVQLAHFEEAWPEAQRAATLAAKIHHAIDAAYDVGTADRGHVRVAMRDGQVYESTLQASEHQPARIDVEAKFADCAQWLLSATERRRICDAFFALEHVADMSSVMALLAGDAASSLRSDTDSEYQHHGRPSMADF
jgi:hypothetical protein